MAHSRFRTAIGLGAALLALAQPIVLRAGEGTAAEYQLYQPQDADERGLWMKVDEAERTLRTSPAVIRDPALNAYVRGVLCRTVGQDRCRNVRLYLVRTPQFNATMAPNGMMEVWSGLLLRTQNEAQLAAVLGHEYTHFENRHTVMLFRQIKAKTDAASFINLIPYAGIVSLAMLSSVFGFSRDMEREADAGGLAKMARAGYDTREAALIWERLREEMDATAAARNAKSRKDKNGGLFATHPPTAERVTSLRAAAAKDPGTAGATEAEAYRRALAPFWPGFVDDQLKLNDFGASEYLLASLAAAGWTPALLYARGELYRRRGGMEDLQKASVFYGQAMETGGEMPELWRGRGMSLLKLDHVEQGRADLREYLRRAPDAPDRPMMTMLAGEGS